MNSKIFTIVKLSTANLDSIQSKFHTGKIKRKINYHEPQT